MAQVRGASIPVVERPARRGPRVGVVLLVLSLLFFSVNFGQEWWVSHQTQQEAAQLQQKISAAKRLNAQLQSQLSYYNGPQYIVPAARALGMARPGDHLMIVQQPPPIVHTIRVYKPAPTHESFLTRLLQAIFQ